MKDNKSRCGFWTGVLVGLLLSWILSRLSPDPNRVARVMYNLIAPLYDPALDLAGGLHELRQALVDKLELKAGDEVLEVSVGTGANLPYVAERIGPTGKIYGIDISEGMLAQARKKLGGIPCPVELQWGNAEDLPYPSDYFDTVLNLGAMNFITNRKKAIDEMVRVAKPGAKIVFGDETLVPDGLLRSLLSYVVLGLIPRLRPPTDLVPEPGAHLSYLANGFIYVIDWRKAHAMSQSEYLRKE
ncbi:MAG: methyltransferase domain-containing protein [Dehalococcoidales bacterium]|nr:methyltransferase domain-containing protein [Dehalococcoidales bacterium]